MLGAKAEVSCLAVPTLALDSQNGQERSHLGQACEHDCGCDQVSSAAWCGGTGWSSERLVWVGEGKRKEYFYYLIEEQCEYIFKIRIEKCVINLAFVILQQPYQSSL